jgi:hypothetical protein
MTRKKMFYTMMTMMMNGGMLGHETRTSNLSLLPSSPYAGVGPAGEAEGHRLSVPRKSRKEPMESPDMREQAAYGMLKQVLQNHITTHEMALSVALTGCAMILTSACWTFYDTEEDMQAHVPYTMTRLKEHLRVRQATPPLLPFATVQRQAGDDAVLSHNARALGMSLARFIQDTVDEYALPTGAAWGIALELTADVLAMLLHERQHTLVDVDALIDETLQPVMIRQMRQFRQQVDEG